MIKRRCPTLSSYGEKWLKATYHHWKPATESEYERVFRLYVKPQLGSKPLDEIKRSDIKNFIGSLQVHGLSKSRSQVILAVVSGIFTSAMDDELVTARPCSKTHKFFRKNKIANKIDTLTVDEVQSLLEKAKTKLPHSLYTLYLLAARCGLRIGEILALEWADINFEDRTLTVSKSWDYERKKLLPPKNGKIRKVNLTPMVVEELKRLRTTSKVHGFKGTVFVDRQGKRMSYRVVAAKLKRVAPRPIGMHLLRHTYETLRIAKGDNILDVSKQLGHHSVAFTLDKYAHWLPGEHKSQVDELDHLHLSAPHTHPTSESGSNTL